MSVATSFATYCTLTGAYVSRPGPGPPLGTSPLDDQAVFTRSSPAGTTGAPTSWVRTPLVHSAGARARLVAPDGAELFVDGRVVRLRGLAPGQDFAVAGVAFTTMPNLGALRCVFATANDVHFGETVCGHVAGADEADSMRVADGASPYPEVMNAAVVADIAACSPRRWW